MKQSRGKFALIKKQSKGKFQSERKQYSVICRYFSTLSIKIEEKDGWFGASGYPWVSIAIPALA